MLLRESAHTAAKSRTNISTNSGKSYQTAGGHLGSFRGSTIQKSGEAVRLAPTLVNVCGFIWEWTYPRWNFGGGGFRVYCNKFKSLGKLSNGWNDWPQNLARICRSISEWIYAKQIAPRDTRGHLGGFRVQTFKSLRKQSNRWTDWHQLWFTSADSSGNGHMYAKSKSPLNTPGGISGGGGVGGHKFKSQLSNCCTDWHQIGRFV